MKSFLRLFTYHYPPQKPEVLIMRVIEDLRPLLFEDAAWFNDLEEDTPDLWAAWRVTKSAEPGWWSSLLSAAAAYAQQRNLLSHYRTQIAGINPSRMRDAVADHGHAPTFPIWEIVNELIVALYLEATADWRFVAHEPQGHRTRRGDWEFELPDGSSRVFVEVKSLDEPPPRGTGVYSRPFYTSRLTSVLKGAYRQLPSDDRSTMVVIVGREILAIPFGIIHGDLFQTLYGQMQVSFNVMPYDPESVQVGPSFRDRFVHSKKNRRLGVAAGFMISGMEEPGLGFYAIHNPYSDHEAQLEPEALPGIRQFWVDRAGTGTEIPGRHPREHWAAIVAFIGSGGMG